MMQNLLLVKYNVRCIAQNLISQAHSVCFVTRHLFVFPYYPLCCMTTVIMLLEYVWTKEHNLLLRCRIISLFSKKFSTLGVQITTY